MPTADSKGMNDFNFDELEFADNPDPRASCVLVLDCPGSMADTRDGEVVSPIEALNSGLDTLVTELHKDPLAKRRVEVSVVTFGSAVTPATDFATVENLILPTLVPSGATSMGAAINEAFDAIESRKKTYKENAVQYFKSWVILITDGIPTDDITAAVQRVADAESRNSIAFFAVGVDGADMNVLNKIAPRGALALSGMKFDELFQWVSASQSAVSASNPGDKVALPSPAGWAEI